MIFVNVALFALSFRMSFEDGDLFRYFVFGFQKLAKWEFELCDDFITNRTRISDPRSPKQTRRANVILFCYWRNYDAPNSKHGRRQTLHFPCFVRSNYFMFGKNCFRFRYAWDWKRDCEKSLIRHQRMWCAMEKPILLKILIVSVCFNFTFLRILWTMKQWLTISLNSTHEWKSYIAPYTIYMTHDRKEMFRSKEKKKEKQKLKAFHRVRIVNICIIWFDAWWLAVVTISLITSILCT